MKKPSTTTRKGPARRSQAHQRRRAKQLPPRSQLLFDLFDTVLTAALIGNLVDEAIGVVTRIRREFDKPAT